MKNSLFDLRETKRLKPVGIALTITSGVEAAVQVAVRELGRALGSKETRVTLTLPIPQAETRSTEINESNRNEIRF
jgi:hypothetical protein